MNFFLAKLLARRQQMRREESNIRRNWPKYRRITNKQEKGKNKMVASKKNKVVATAQGNSIGQENLDQLTRETSTSNLLPAVVPGGAEMGVGFQD